MSALTLGNGQILGKDISDKTVFGGVGFFDHIVLVAERLDRRDWSENFLACHVCFFGHIGEHGRRIEKPLAVRNHAAENDLCSLLLGVGNQGRNLVAGFSID